MFTGSRSFKVVFTLTRRYSDVVNDVNADVTRCLMTSTMTSASSTVSALDCIAVHVTSASHFKCDVLLNDASNSTSYGDVVASNDVTTVSRCHSDVL